MTTVSASMVKELRNVSGAGMMDCKRALEATEGDIEKAIDYLRKTGLATAIKKSSRIASEGMVYIHVSQDSAKVMLLEVNSETDFVSKNERFMEFVHKVGEAISTTGVTDIAVLSTQKFAGSSMNIEEERQTLIAQIGENISIRRTEVIQAQEGQKLGYYLHGKRIAAAVLLAGNNAELAKDLAMHIAASNPICIHADEIPQSLLDKEREIFLEQNKDSDKASNMLEKMVEGKLKKYAKEVSLMGQSFVKDPSISIEQLLQKNEAKVLRYSRIELGEGLEKRQDDFVKEVMEQARQ